MAFTVTEIGTGTIATAANLQVTVTDNVTAGDVLLVIASGGDSTSQASANITDSKSSAYTLRKTTSKAGASRRAGLWSAVAAGSLTNGVDFVKFTNAALGKTLQILKVTGLGQESPDASANSVNQTAVTTILSGTSGATVQASELAIGVYIFESNPAFTPPTGYSSPATAALSQGTNFTVAVAYKELSGTGTQSASATIGVGQNAGGLIQTYKATVAIPSLVVPRGQKTSHILRK